MLIKFTEITDDRLKELLLDQTTVVDEDKYQAKKGVGRPRTFYRIINNNHTLIVRPAQYNRVNNALMRTAVKGGSMAVKGSDKMPLSEFGRPMTEAEFNENCRRSVPMLIDRAIKLALTSNKITDVMVVVKELTERGYGKVVDMSDPRSAHEDVIRLGWDSFSTQTASGFEKIQNVQDVENSDNSADSETCET